MLDALCKTHKQSPCAFLGNPCLESNARGATQGQDMQLQLLGLAPEGGDILADVKAGRREPLMCTVHYALGLRALLCSHVVPGTCSGPALLVLQVCTASHPLTGDLPSLCPILAIMAATAGLTAGASGDAPCCDSSLTCASAAGMERGRFAEMPSCLRRCSYKACRSLREPPACAFV